MILIEKDDRIDDILRNLKKDTLLNITSEMFIENLIIEEIPPSPLNLFLKQNFLKKIRI